MLEATRRQKQQDIHPKAGHHTPPAIIPVGSSQVDTQATDFGGQQENKHVLIGVEVIYEAGSEADRGGAIHAVVAVASPLHTPLQDVQHLLRLCEQQRPVPLLLPVIQHLQKLTVQSNQGDEAG